MIENVALDKTAEKYESVVIATLAYSYILKTFNRVFFVFESGR